MEKIRKFILVFIMVCSVYSVQVQCDNIPELVSVKRQAGKVFESVVVDPTRCDYCLNCAPLKGDEVDDSIELLELRRLADPAKHKSLVWPDLEFWNDTLYCASARESAMASRGMT